MSDLVSLERRKQQLQRHYDQLMSLLKTGEVLPEPGPDLALLRAARDALDGDLRLRVLLVGDFSTGKSSFINRFLLKQDLLPAWSTPTTTCPTCIRHGAQLRAVRYQALGEAADLEEEVVTEHVGETLKAWVSTADKRSNDGTSSVIIEVPTLPAGIEVVDAPGLNDPNPERMRRTLDYLNQADGVLFFLNAMRPWTRYEQAVFEGELLNRELLGRLYVVVNYWDQIEASERDDVLAYVEQHVRASLAKGAAAGVADHPVPILPVSAKTGENAALIQEQVWNVLSAGKSQEVLALRISLFNQALTKYERILDNRIALLGLDAQGQARRRTQLQQEIKDYEQQRETFLNNLERLLVLDFQDYQTQFQRQLEGMKDAVMDLEKDALGSWSAEELNEFLVQRLSRLQKQTARQLQKMDATFLGRLRATIEGQKATIGVLPSNALSMQEYVLRWQGLDGEPLAENVPIAMGGMGLAGMLVGAGTAWQTVTVATATPGALAAIGAFFTGAPAAAASSFMLVGIPAIAIGALLLVGAYITKEQGSESLRKQFRAACLKLAEGIEDEQWKSLDQLKANQAKRIAQICADVNGDIHHELQERLTELDAIRRTEDQGAALRALRDQIAGLELRVNG